MHFLQYKRSLHVELMMIQDSVFYRVNQYVQ